MKRILLTIRNWLKKPEPDPLNRWFAPDGGVFMPHEYQAIAYGCDLSTCGHCHEDFYIIHAKHFDGQWDDIKMSLITYAAWQALVENNKDQGNIHFTL